jgi:uncharacterized protein (TIGR03067 family)
MRIFVIVGAMVGLILAAQAGALRGDVGKETEADKIARLIRQLGDDEFAKREAASKELKAIGVAALVALRKADSSDDPEIRSRAKRIADAVVAAAAVANLDKLQGVWAVTTYEIEGKPLPGKGKESTLTITGRRWVMKWAKKEGGEQVESGILTVVNSEKSAVAVDWVHLDGPHKGATVFAICRVDRGTLTFCYSVRPDDRPTEFATTNGDRGRGLIAFSRNATCEMQSTSVATSRLCRWRCGQQLPDRLEAAAARPPHIHFVRAERERRLDDHPHPCPATPRVEVVGLPRRRVADHTIPNCERYHHRTSRPHRTRQLSGGCALNR